MIISNSTPRISLKNQRALITGASRGIGAEIAALFAGAGADLVITGRDVPGLEATQQMVEKAGSRCLSLVSDLRTVEGAHFVGNKALEFLAQSIFSLTTQALYISKVCWKLLLSIGRKHRTSI